MLTVFVIGDVLGAGIYALVGEVGGEVGGAIWAAFLLAGVLALFTAASYSELVTKYPRAAGAALYVNRAFKSEFFTFVVAFAVMASGVTSAATLATAFGGDYLSEFVDLPTMLVGLVVRRGDLARELPRHQGVGRAQLRADRDRARRAAARRGDRRSRSCSTAAATRAARSSSSAGEAVPLAILAGASLAFFALIGFEDSVNVAEETRDPSRVFPRALFLGLGIAGVVYMLVTVIASMAVADRPSSSTPTGRCSRWSTRARSPCRRRCSPAIALFALTNGALINLIMASRLVYGMSREGIVPEALGRVHPGRSTPYVAIVFTASLAALLVIVGDLETLADTTVLLLLFVFVCVNAAVLVLRREPVEHEHFRAPTLVPVLGVLACVALIVQKAFDDPAIFAYAGGLIAIGIALWAVNSSDAFSVIGDA